MFQRQDYILRIIEQMGQMLARLLDQILNRPGEDLSGVEADLNGAAHRVGLDLQLARRLAPDTLHMMVSPAGVLDPSRCWVLAELLYLHGLQAERTGDTAAAHESFIRSLYLYELVEPDWKPVVELPGAAARVAELKERQHGADPAHAEGE
jgi:hypothetical protein